MSTGGILQGRIKLQPPGKHTLRIPKLDNKKRPICYERIRFLLSKTIKNNQPMGCTGCTDEIHRGHLSGLAATVDRWHHPRRIAHAQCHCSPCRSASHLLSSPKHVACHACPLTPSKCTSKCPTFSDLFFAFRVFQVT